jgi:hypothetical protein
VTPDRSASRTSPRSVLTLLCRLTSIILKIDAPRAAALSTNRALIFDFLKSLNMSAEEPLRNQMSLGGNGKVVKDKGDLPNDFDNSAEEHA